MRRSLTLTLDDFGRSTLESEAERYSLGAYELVQHAARHYLADRSAGRTAHRIPDFRKRETGRSSIHLALDLDVDVWHELDAEARRQGVTVERLLAHAALYLVADLESGRVSRRLLEEDPLSPSGATPGR